MMRCGSDAASTCAAAAAVAAAAPAALSPAASVADVGAAARAWAQ